MISGALLRTLDFVSARSAEYMGYLEKGQLPPARLTLTSFEESFVLEGALPALARVRVCGPSVCIWCMLLGTLQDRRWLIPYCCAG